MVKKKRFLGFFVLALTLLVMINPTSAEAESYASPTKSKILVDGKNVDFEAYNIKDNNYFKLRDLASILSGTDSSFDVKWDGQKRAINIQTKSKYTSVGGEMTKVNNKRMRIRVNKSPVYKDGKKVELASYTIGGNNYFKLRDLGEHLGFGVGYDNSTKTVMINSDGSVPSGSSDKPKDGSTAKSGIKNLEEYKLKIEYNKDDIEYKYKIEGDGSVTAVYDDAVKNIEWKGKKAQELIENKLLHLDYSKSKTEIIDSMLESLGEPKDYKKIKLEIEYKDGRDKFEFERSR